MEVVTAGTGRCAPYDLDSKLLWEFGGMSILSIPTPFAAGGLLYVTSGYVLDPLRPVYAIRPGAAGDVSLKKGEKSNKYIAWCQPRRDRTTRRRWFMATSLCSVRPRFPVLL